jgi:hypothetical protein
MAVSMVANSRAADGKVNYSVKDWLEKECFKQLSRSGTRHHWHIEVSRARSQHDDSFQYVGMQTFRIGDEAKSV